MRISIEQEKELTELAVNYITRVLEKSLKNEIPTESKRDHQLETAMDLFRNLRAAEDKSFC